MNRLEEILKTYILAGLENRLELFLEYREFRQEFQHIDSLFEDLFAEKKVREKCEYFCSDLLPGVVSENGTQNTLSRQRP